jgi:N-acetylmuramoyl-L-alanine amidase
MIYSGINKLLGLEKDKNKVDSNISVLSALFPNAVEVSNEINKEDPDFLDNNLSSTENVVTCPNDLELINYVRNYNLTRKTSFLVWHCTATNQNASVSSIVDYWKNNLKWKTPGYHIIVKPDGSWTLLSNLNNPTNGAKGYNQNGIHISYIGGINSKGQPINNITENQKRIFVLFTELIKEKNPNIKLIGHNEISKKACPCFNIQDFAKKEYSKYL